MASTPLLDTAPPAAVRELASAASIHEYRRGTYLFH